LKQAARYSMVFLAGLLLGSVMAAGLVAWRWKRDFQRFRVSGITEQALAAKDIYAGRGRQTADRIRLALPGMVRGVERTYPKPEGKEWAYWLVSDVYQASHTEVPAQLRPLLTGLPPRPSCRKPISNGNYPVAP
jgi:hypothetical protein